MAHADERNGLVSTYKHSLAKERALLAGIELAYASVRVGRGR